MRFYYTCHSGECANKETTLIFFTMKKINKILLCFSVTLGLFCLSEEKETQASIIPGGTLVTDLSSIFTTAQQMLQDADISGLFSQYPDIEMKTQQFLAWKEQFEKFTSFYGKLQKGMRYASQITATMAYFTREIEYFYSMYVWFSSNGASPQIVMAAANCVSAFRQFFSTLQEDSNMKTEFIKSLTSGDALQILAALDGMMKDYESQFYSASSYYRTRLSDLYFKHCRMKANAANLDFYAKRVFY